MAPKRQAVAHHDTPVEGAARPTPTPPRG